MSVTISLFFTYLWLNFISHLKDPKSEAKKVPSGPISKHTNILRDNNVVVMQITRTSICVQGVITCFETSASDFASLAKWNRLVCNKEGGKFAKASIKVCVVKTCWGFFLLAPYPQKGSTSCILQHTQIETEARQCISICSSAFWFLSARFACKTFFFFKSYCHWFFN